MRRFDRWLRSSPLFLLVVLLLFFAGAAFEIQRDGREVWRWFDRRYNWRDHEYAKLKELHSDFTLAKFEEELGAPLFRQTSLNGKWTEYVFRGREYWVQAITRVGGESVGFYAVTSCARDFAPLFSLADGTVVRLQRSTLGGLRKEAFWYRYMLPASTPVVLMEISPSSHATNFKTFSWGFNGACAEGPPSEKVGQLYELGPGRRQGFVAQLPKALGNVGTTITVNTFAEWGPTEDGGLISDGWPLGLQIGVNEIYVEGVANETYRASGGRG